VLAELWAQALFKPADLFDDDGHLLAIHQMPVHARKCIKRMRVRRVYLWQDGKRRTGKSYQLVFTSKLRALQLLGLHYGLFDYKRTERDNAEKLTARVHWAQQRVKDATLPGQQVQQSRSRQRINEAPQIPVVNDTAFVASERCASAERSRLPSAVECARLLGGVS
jgi:hypothetical protein